MARPIFKRWNGFVELLTAATASPFTSAEAGLAQWVMPWVAAQPVGIGAKKTFEQLVGGGAKNLESIRQKKNTKNNPQNARLNGRTPKNGTPTTGIAEGASQERKIAGGYS